MPYSVLILDDDADFNSLLTDIFEQADYAVTSQMNPTEALELFRQNEFDLVVADQKMPDMSGAEFMQHCKQIRPQIPVIMVSGYLDNDIIRELISEGVGGVFLKPLNIFSLLERTSALIEESRKPGTAPQKELAEEPENETDAKLGFPFRSFPCKSSISTNFAQRIYSSRDFRSTLTLIGEPGTHYRAICEDIRGFYPEPTEHFIFLRPGNTDLAQVMALIEQARQEDAARVTCVLLDFENMGESEKKLAATMLKGESGFKDAGVSLRVIFCVSTDLDLLFDEGLIDENLYIMMGTVEVRVPPLRECSADIGGMAQQIVADIAREKAWPQIPRLEKAARDFLRVQNWPGNYDELRGSLQKVMQVDAGEVLTLKIVKAALQGDTGATPRARLESHLSNQLVDTLRAAAILFGGDRAQVAALFGADVDAVASKLQ